MFEYRVLCGNNNHSCQHGCKCLDFSDSLSSELLSFSTEPFLSALKLDPSSRACISYKVGQLWTGILDNLAQKIKNLAKYFEGQKIT